MQFKIFADKAALLFSPKYATSDKNPANVTAFLLLILKSRSGTVTQTLVPKWLC